MELYRRFRPKKLSEISGQLAAVRSLEGLLQGDRFPHALLLAGPSGTGKTTLARILRREIGCSTHDFEEINAADARGIDTVREIRGRVNLSPLAGKSRIWLIDEAHKMTGDAQTALLKILEDPPSHAYFFLATTDVNKIIRTVQTRCVSIHLQPLSDKELVASLKRVLELSGIEVASELILFKIAEAAEGSARKALQILQDIAGQPLDKQLESIEKPELKKQAIELARALIDPKAKWEKVSAILKGLEAEEPEGLRHLVLSYAATVVLGGGPLAGRANKILCEFEANFYDSKRPGLIRACWGVLN